MRKYCSIRWFSKLVVTGLVIALLTALVISPEISTAVNDRTGQNVNFTSSSSRNMQAGFSASADCLYIAEPVSGNLTKPSSSARDIVPDVQTSGGFQADSLHPGKYIHYSNKVPRKSFSQICFLLDLPPPQV
jgi:hypothetical protein